jgi:hypothetical protein
LVSDLLTRLNTKALENLILFEPFDRNQFCSGRFTALNRDIAPVNLQTLG